MEMSAPTKLPFSVLGDFAQSSATQPTGQFPAQFDGRSDVQPDEQSPAELAGTAAAEADRESVAVPIGVLEVPIGVWGSRRVETNSGQSERVEVFAEDTSTVIVFPQGAVIRLSASVAPGQLVVIANRKSGQVMLCRVVNIRTYPNIRGYAEIEFMHSATGFWGSYASQGTLRLAVKVASAIPSASADFWSNGFPKEEVSVPPKDVAASPAAPAVRAKKEPIANQRSKVPFGGQPVQPMAAIGTDSEARLDATGRNSSNRQMVLAPASSPPGSIRPGFTSESGTISECELFILVVAEANRANRYVRDSCAEAKFGFGVARACTGAAGRIRSFLLARWRGAAFCNQSDRSNARGFFGFANSERCSKPAIQD